MKKLLILLLISSIFAVGKAQNTPEEQPAEKADKTEKEYKPLVVRDRLVFDIYHSFWMGTRRRETS